jgi:hypothetical protein
MNIRLRSFGKGLNISGPALKGRAIEAVKLSFIRDASRALEASLAFLRPLRLVFSFLVLLTASPALYAQDITSQVEANQNITLSGNATVTLPGGTTTYTATTGLSGAGTLSIQGTGTLVLDQVNNYTLPTVGETISTQGYFGTARTYTYDGYSGAGFIGDVYTINNPDSAAVTIGIGTTLDIASSGSTDANVANINSGSGLNLDNIKDNGLLEMTNQNNPFLHLGIVSGTGSVWMEGAGVQMLGVNTFSGTLVNDTGMNLGTDHAYGSAPDAQTIFDNGTLVVNTPLTESMEVTQNIYENHFGGDIPSFPDSVWERAC